MNTIGKKEESLKKLETLPFNYVTGVTVFSTSSAPTFDTKLPPVEEKIFWRVITNFKEII